MLESKSGRLLVLAFYILVTSLLLPRLSHAQEQLLVSEKLRSVNWKALYARLLRDLPWEN